MFQKKTPLLLGKFFGVQRCPLTGGLTELPYNIKLLYIPVPLQVSPGCTVIWSQHVLAPARILSSVCENLAEL